MKVTKFTRVLHNMFIDFSKTKDTIHTIEGPMQIEICKNMIDVFNDKYKTFANTFNSDKSKIILDKLESYISVLNIYLDTILKEFHYVQ